MHFNKFHVVLLMSAFLLEMTATNCSKGSSAVPVVPVIVDTTPVVVGTNDIDMWLTKSNQTALLLKQTGVLSFGTVANTATDIVVDSTQRYQTIDGFGYTLTGGSAYVINQMPAAEKQNLLNELFGTNSNSITVSYLRISIGASDLNASTFTYDDMPAGQTDLSLANFSLNNDAADLIPLLKQILLINPSIKILATPWSPPVWMKDNGSFVGGNLLPAYYDVYADYFVKYIQQMAAQGITIDAITPQNEPLNPANNPSLSMTAGEQANFIKNSLGPKFSTAGITTKIIIYDHNCDRTDYPLAVLNDAQAKPYVNGSAFHLYAGTIGAISAVHDAHPDKALYFTEQYTSSTGDFGGDLKWHLSNVIIGSMRNWSRNALEWNLANDASFGPHTSGGCTTCKGALTIGAGGTVTRNVAYYIIGHASKFVPPGSVRIGSNNSGDINTVAFQTPAGKKILVTENNGNSTITFNIKFNGRWSKTQLDAGAVATYVW